uniref:Uncharacterized protein n=1 Tax=Cannabis sativa TaxID=3483 RepID=A0A803Q485_CANSA
MSSITKSHDETIITPTTSIPTLVTNVMPKITVEIVGVLRSCGIPPPNPPNNPPLLPQLNGVNVFFSCDDGNTYHIAKALTNPNGVFKFIIRPGLRKP